VQRLPAAVRIGLILGWIGVVAFGGPAAHVALMRRQLVERRRWIDAADFNRMFAACNLIPGPSSTELAMFIGYRLAGWAGLLLGGAFFIAPAMALMLALAAVYSRYSTAPVVHGILHGVRPVVVAIIAWAALDLARKLVEHRAVLLVVPGALVLFAIGLNPVLILVLGGAAGSAVMALRGRGIGSAAALAATHADRLPLVFFTFLKIGAVAFGSGYVLFAFLDADFVRGFRWLEPSQLADAFAIGQVTPGPVFTTATFLGYLFAGVPGALLATLGIFLPGFLLIPFLDRLVRLVEKRRLLRLFLEAVNATVIGLVIAVGYELARASLVDAVSVALALLAFALIVWRPLAAPVAVGAGALVGLLAMMTRS
jgi:chromate transporter